MKTNQQPEPPVTTLEVVKPGEQEALTAITKGEVDIQIATAHKFPRSLATFNRRAMEMVSMDEDTAASCLYSRPVGKDPRTGQQKYAEGLSVRMAEIVGTCYGNLRVGAMILEQSERQVRARGYAHDLETNFASTSEVVEATVKRDGTPYDERMRVVIAKAALAKARRDAIFQVVPRALCKKLEETAREVAVGDASTLDKRRAAVMDWVNKLGVPPERVFGALSIAGVEDIGVKELETLTGLKTAIKDGDISVDEAFPASSVPVAKPKLFAKGKDEKATAAADPAVQGRATEPDPKTTGTKSAPEATAGTRQLSDEKAKDELEARLSDELSQRGCPVAACVSFFRTNGMVKETEGMEGLTPDQLRRYLENPDAVAKAIKDAFAIGKGKKANS